MPAKNKSRKRRLAARTDPIPTKFQHPLADLVFVAGSGPPARQGRFLVRSAMVCEASDDLREAVHRQWRNGGKDRKPTIHFSNDDPEAFRVVLSAIHLCSSGVPRAPSVSDLYYIMLLVDKYRLKHCIRYWAPGWLRSVRKADPSESCAVLFIGWHLGDADLVDSLVKHWIRNAFNTRKGLATHRGHTNSHWAVMDDMEACREFSHVTRPFGGASQMLTRFALFPQDTSDVYDATSWSGR